MVIWLTGLSGSGKTTLCNALWNLLKPRFPETVSLDGDVIRSAFGEGLGYREEDRVIQITRIQNLAKVLSDQGLLVLVAALYASPALLTWNRQNIQEYFEVYLATPWETLIRRDSKGLYSGAKSGKIPNVVGMDIQWHIPEAPDMVISGEPTKTPDLLAQEVLDAVPFMKLRIPTP
jgi:adenylylsulfate kinase-like enzyme